MNTGNNLTHADRDKINFLKTRFKSYLINKGMKSYHKLSTEKKSMLDDQFKVWMLEQSVFGVDNCLDSEVLLFQCFIAHNVLDRKEFDFKRWAENKGYIVDQEIAKHISI